jgi:hypothetical protein
MSGHDASKSPRDRLAPEMLLYGFVRAVGRSREAASARKPWPILTTPLTWSAMCSFAGFL